MDWFGSNLLSLGVFSFIDVGVGVGEKGWVSFTHIQQDIVCTYDSLLSAEQGGKNTDPFLPIDGDYFCR